MPWLYCHYSKQKQNKTRAWIRGAKAESSIFLLILILLSACPETCIHSLRGAHTNMNECEKMANFGPDQQFEWKCQIPPRGWIPAFLKYLKIKLGASYVWRLRFFWKFSYESYFAPWPTGTGHLSVYDLVVNPSLIPTLNLCLQYSIYQSLI